MKSYTGMTWMEAINSYDFCSDEKKQYEEGSQGSRVDFGSLSACYKHGPGYGVNALVGQMVDGVVR